MDISTPSISYLREAFEAQIDKDTVQSTRQITFVIAAESTGAKHRNRYVYNWDNWELSSFNANPTVGYQHTLHGDNPCVAANPDDVIAKASAWMDTYKGRRAIISKATFEPAEINPTAEKVFQKIIFGSLTAASVGVMPIGEITKTSSPEAGTLYNFPGQSLLEWSVVNIPADPEALRRSMRSSVLTSLSYAQRQLPHLSLMDIEKMTVREIMDSLESQYNSKENPGPDPELDKYLATIKQFKRK